MNQRGLRSELGGVLVLLILALSACRGGTASNESGTSPSPATGALAKQIKALEASGQLPKLDRSVDIRGPDNDNNGIRDDIDTWIAAQPISDEQKKAARQAARVRQAELLVDLTNKVELDRLGDLSMASVKCLRLSFMPDYQRGYDLSSTIVAITANTKQRAKQYLAYNRAISGSSGRLPEGNTCEP
ncbi:hypothetical protein [Hydrogenophaga sp.]|uniref:hypothetical protein n=1 Tax=Hydrogenophaga sp. TaxID=1904254 RepID=UPI00272139F0|nr:hypothetical protein [Hydrogenophaga sp.]MDO9135777.1 hypothetical protein [Hydrogenophaga sp.]